MTFTSNSSQYPSSNTTKVTWSHGDSAVNKLTRSDFRRKDLKGMAGRYYFSYQQSSIEITLEPCLSGFDIGFYKEGVGNTGEKKECTNVTFPIYLDEEKEYEKEKVHNLEGNKYKDTHDRIMVLDMFTTQERSNRVWDKAISIANEKLRIYKADEQLKKWKMIERDQETKDEDIAKPYWNPTPAPYYPSVPPQINTPNDPNIWSCVNKSNKRLKNYLKDTGLAPKLKRGQDTTGTVSSGTL